MLSRSPGASVCSMTSAVSVSYTSSPSVERRRRGIGWLVITRQILYDLRSGCQGTPREGRMGHDDRVKLGRTEVEVTRLGLGLAPLGGLFDAVGDRPAY